MVTWPSSLPQAFVMDSYQEQLADNSIRDQFDVGPAGVRRRSTAAVYQISGPMRMTTTQWETLKTFYNDTILHGSMPFDFPEQGCPNLEIAAGGTNFGDLTGSAGLASIFDSNTNQAFGAGGTKTGTSAYVGKTLDSPRPVHYAEVYGPNNGGYIASGTPTVTLTLYGKQGAAPANATDGTALGSVSFTDTSDESDARTIESSDTVTNWDHIWVALSHNGASLGISITELWMYLAQGVAVRFTAPPARTRVGPKWNVSLQFEVLP
jgi:hypothetical protein